MAKHDNSGNERDWGEVLRNIEELLGVDREYRARMAAPGESPRADPWLVQRDHRQYIARFAQSLAPGPKARASHLLQHARIGRLGFLLFSAFSHVRVPRLTVSVHLEEP